MQRGGICQGRGVVYGVSMELEYLDAGTVAWVRNLHIGIEGVYAGVGGIGVQTKSLYRKLCGAKTYQLKGVKLRIWRDGGGG